MISFGDRYQIIGPPREGGMSMVYPVRESPSGIQRAVKLARSDADPHLGPLSFRAERRALTTLLHPNILRCLDTGATADHRDFLVLEWMPTHLHDHISSTGRMSWEHFLVDFGFPLLEALRHAHNRKIAHRDLKPKNVLLSTELAPKVADFGIARHMEKEQDGNTLAGAGSVPYTPTDWDDGRWSYSRDCYSWAAIAVSCLAGEIFADIEGLMHALDSLDAAVIPVTILRKALAQTPEDRYLIAGDLAADVESSFRQILVARGAQQRIALTFANDALKNCLFAWQLNDVDQVRKRVIQDLNDLCHAEVVWNEKSNVRLVGVTCVAEGEVLDPIKDRIRINRVQVLSPSTADAARADLITISHFLFTAEPARFSEDGRRSIQLMERYVSAEQGKREAVRLERERERPFELFFGLLREKERFYRENHRTLSYRRLVNQHPIYTAILEEEFEPDQIGDSLVFTLSNNRAVVFDVLDVQFDQLNLRHKLGPIDLVPVADGVLHTNRLAELQAIGKQRAALETVRSGKAVSPYVKDLICDPSSAEAPDCEELPGNLGGLSPDKHVVLQKALGVRGCLVVEGPPGTGKTTLIAELIVQYLRKFPTRRILLSSQTHSALDHVLGKLRGKELDESLVRITKTQESKVDPDILPLLLSRKVEQWAQKVERESRRYVDQYASNRGIVATELRVAILGEERIRRLDRIQEAKTRLEELDKQEAITEQRRKAQVELAEKVDADELLTETSTTAERRALVIKEIETHERAEQRFRDQLQKLGEFGSEVATASREEITDWVNALLPNTDEAATFRQFVDLNHQWLERLGASQEFVPAVLGEARVVAGTCVGLAGVSAIYDDEYDLCVIDEASKASPMEVLIPMSRAHTWILVGDPLQLPPFVEATEVPKVEGFSDEEAARTLLDYFLERLPAHSKAELVEQRRMTEGIGCLISAVFYNDKLINVRRDSDRFRAIQRALPKPVTWISTSGQKANEQEVPIKTYRNQTECDIVVGLLRDLEHLTK